VTQQSRATSATKTYKTGKSRKRSYSYVYLAIGDSGGPLDDKREEEAPPVHELTSLPPELLSLVLARLDVKSLARAASSCSVLTRIEQANRQNLWEVKCKEDLDHFKVHTYYGSLGDGHWVDHYPDASMQKGPCMFNFLGMAWKDVYQMHMNPPVMPPVEAINMLRPSTIATTFWDAPCFRAILSLTCGAAQCNCASPLFLTLGKIHTGSTSTVSPQLTTA
jgi:hypothetical protein